MPINEDSITASKDGGQSTKEHNEEAGAHHSESNAEQSIKELKSLWNQLLLLKDPVKQWSQASIDLFFIELRTSLSTLKQSLLLNILFVVLSVFFLLSLCAGLGFLTYHYTHVILLSYMGFVASLGLVLVLLLCWQRYLRKLIGFRHTIEQVKEGLDVILQQKPKDH